MSSSRDNPLTRFSAFTWGIGIFLLFAVGLGLIYWADSEPSATLEDAAATTRYKTKGEVFAAEDAALDYKEVEAGKKVQVPPRDVFDYVGRKLATTKAAAVEDPSQVVPGTATADALLKKSLSAPKVDLAAIEKMSPALETPIDPAVAELGKKQYFICSACHGQSGEGSPTGPPHAGSEWVTGPVTNLIRIQLRGLTGPIKVKGQDFKSALVLMPPADYQKDEEIAAVLTYVRNSFGNKASAVTPEQVKALRSEVGQPPLTVDDLLKPN